LRLTAASGTDAAEALAAPVSGMKIKVKSTGGVALVNGTSSINLDVFLGGAGAGARTVTPPGGTATSVPGSGVVPLVANGVVQSEVDIFDATLTGTTVAHRSSTAPFAELFSPWTGTKVTVGTGAATSVMALKVDPATITLPVIIGIIKDESKVYNAGVYRGQVTLNFRATWTS